MRRNNMITVVILILIVVIVIYAVWLESRISTIEKDIEILAEINKITAQMMDVLADQVETIAGANGISKENKQ